MNLSRDFGTAARVRETTGDFRLMRTPKIVSAEVALILGVLLNSFCVSLMAKSGLGISTLSSVPFVLSHIYRGVSFGTWNFIVQGLVILMLMAAISEVRVSYLFSFVTAVVFGRFVDLYQLLLEPLPETIIFRWLYFFTGLFLMAFGASLFILCHLPVLPFDTFVRDITMHFGWSVMAVKTIYDAVFVIATIALSLSKLGYLDGIGMGTVISALSTGTITSIFCKYLGGRYEFRVKIPWLQRFARS